LTKLSRGFDERLICGTYRINMHTGLILDKGGWCHCTETSCERW